ncbi:phosphotriesterase [Actinopolymorpha rutila]|uniref:Phosphotriesterase-related protein n=1 Tax=Actinopolymorpha rutila TaxID=446787 RepID=A0A852ZHY0_9ACTN|nr:phosphotriesterase [Actinopolymorpha rutila]NYH92731.1 phosphotriesterase-related protein [Actinopolymorpha rutila]
MTTPAAVPDRALVPDSVLVHEHVLVDFGGVADPHVYDPDEVFAAAKPKLDEVYALGCRRLLECTPQGLGRDPVLLARLADATGVEIGTNTGVYGAADRVGVPSYVHELAAEQLARRFVDEHTHGIAGNPAARPVFVKTAVRDGALEELDRKLVRAAALTARETGLTVASHTTAGVAALEQLDIFADVGVSPDQFVWVHAQAEPDGDIHEQVARAGAWVEFDGLRPGDTQWQRACVERMAAAGLLGRTLVANDSGWYHAGEPGGGEFLGYTFVYDELLPALDESWWRTLLVDNPVAAFG